MAGEPAPDLRSPPVGHFLAVLRGSGLLDDARFDRLRDDLTAQRVGADPETVAGSLIDDGTLTHFQATRLLRGKTSGWIIGRYVVLDVLGMGGMGSVFKARHRLMDRVVALKIITPEAAQSRDSIQRFLGEMKLVAKLDHPNVVRAFDADLHDGLPYIVMEYVEGEDLSKVNRRPGGMPTGEVVDAMIQAARGLAHAHEVGIIHRDIKPSNLIRDSSGAVKVLDLGVGVFMEDVEELAARENNLGKVVGTIEYMSPEQARCRPLDARTDLFSLGCTMYFLLSGRHPYVGKDRPERLAARIRSLPRPIAQVRPDLPRGLAAIVDRLLAVRPEDRYGSATEVAEVLARWQEEESGDAAPAESAAIAAPARPRPDEPDPPLLNWSLIEEALAPRREPAGEGKRGERLHRPTPKSRPGRPNLASHRRSLESDGQESGRAVENLYRAELGRLHMASAHGNMAAESRSVGDLWMERLERWLEAYLSAPVAYQILFPLLFITSLLALALVMALT